jgi:hypothetical protein
MSTEAWTPTRAAIRITKQLNLFSECHRTPRFPVNVTELAMEAANLFGWKDPITDVRAESIPGFEGALFANDARSRWMLLYSKDLTSDGRIRFTQAHELGHYILHRLECDRFECTDKDMLNWKADGRNIEAESDLFASYLLMPLDDYRDQLKSAPISLAHRRHPKVARVHRRVRRIRYVERWFHRLGPFEQSRDEGRCVFCDSKR